MKNCDHYILGELTNEVYCNARDCIYKIKVKERILPNCSVDGKFGGPCLDEVVGILSEEEVRHLLRIRLANPPL